MSKPALILASGSAYRRELLGRLGVAFDTASPDIDESPRPDESHPALARRLAVEKARAVAASNPSAWIIGSDQVASLDGQQLGKPGTVERAAEQLAACAGRTVRFITAVALVGPAGELHEHIDVTRVRFRALSRAGIQAYLTAEPALDCAGSFKSEGLGISLTDHVASDDPTALIGLPLIAVARMLRGAGLL